MPLEIKYRNENGSLLTRTLETDALKVTDHEGKREWHLPSLDAYNGTVGKPVNKRWFVDEYGDVRVRVTTHVTCEWSKNGVDFHAHGMTVCTLNTCDEVKQMIDMLRANI